MATNWNGPNHSKSFEDEYAAAALSGAIFLSPSKDTQFYAGCGAMQCDPTGADKGDTKAGARTRWHVDSPRTSPHPAHRAGQDDFAHAGENICRSGGGAASGARLSKEDNRPAQDRAGAISLRRTHHGIALGAREDHP